MSAVNLPSASSWVAWMRGVSLCSVIVKAGAWAAAGTAAPARRARSTNSGRTSEAMVESQGEAQPLARRDPLRRVHAEPSPVHPEAEIGEPAAGRRQPIAGEPSRPVADEPRLPGVAEHHQVGTLQGEQGPRLLVRRPRSAVGPVERDVAAVFRLG